MADEVSTDEAVHERYIAPDEVDTDEEATDEANEALLNAARDGSVDGIKAALKAGADINFKPGFKREEDGWVHHIAHIGPALYTAAIRGHVAVVSLLLREGASVVQRTSSMAPLHIAAMKGFTEIVDLLVQHGATVDVRDGWLYTPLMYACDAKSADTVRRLIELGARTDYLEDYLAKGTGKVTDGHKECLKLIEEAKKTKLLRCCNPKCGKPGDGSTLELCGKCKLTRYCSRDCQEQHWSVGHKKCCGHDVYNDEEETDPLQQLVSLMTNHIRHFGSESLEALSAVLPSAPQ
ncbi:kinase D-interacting substrate of 220 kDa-like [Branchiostoma floridae]|uniref:Kinase D-interacting substrate of 220 kDa-like n=1 Tax=Branchiostoma floridae TaxID=7739 RepID=A0A9J7HRN3_BRAFL|nr:kinase D-interacting substrate of 220 kDa-like [Branchiostoma floridae]